MTAPSYLKTSAWSFLLSWGQQGITAIVAFVLASILGPEGYGLVIIAISIVMLLQNILDQGLMIAIIQYETLEDTHLDSAFWALIVFSVLASLTLFAGAGVWAELNGNPEIEIIVWALIPIVFFKSISLVPHALLRRELNFRRLAILTNIALLLGGIVGLTLVLNGAGVWALVGQFLTSELLLAFLFWHSSTYTPRLHFHKSKLLDLLPVASGGFLTGLGNFLRNRADVFIMGVMFGPVAVGLFRLSMRIQELVLTLLMRPIAMVALPALSKIQNNRDETIQVSSKFLRLAAGLTIPAMGLTAGLSIPIMQTIGEKWLPATPALSILCIAGSVHATAYFVPQILNSSGRSWYSALWTWVSAVVYITGLVLVSFVVSGEAVEYQILVIAVIVALVSFVVNLPLGAFLLKKVLGIPYAVLVSPLLRPGIIGLIGFATPITIRHFGLLGGLPALGQLIVLASIGAAVILPTTFLLNRKFFDEVALPVFSYLTKRRNDPL